MMNRRSFIRKAGTATAGAMVLPYILPSGRLFAASGSRVVNHVVVCLYAGGVRNIDSVHKADGNLMRNILTGTESISADIAPGINLLPTIGSPLQTQGTLYREFRFAQGSTGHYSGHSTALTGQYNINDVNIKVRPPMPTVFEYYRKHTQPATSALNAWWVSNQLGPYPALNFSSHPDYGDLYGANYIQWAGIFSQGGYNSLGTPKLFGTADMDRVRKVRGFVDDNFANVFSGGGAGVANTEADRAALEQFLLQTLNAAFGGAYQDPWGIGWMSNDQSNVFIAELLIQQFKPELLVVNMTDVDVCHSNFTAYADNLVRADYALAHLWQTIQSTPGMAGDTILIAVPEHGRNLEPNTLVDAYGRGALDHTNTDTSREIFCLIAGPSGKVQQNQLITQVVGESIDIVPTVAHILGFHDQVAGMLPGRVLDEAVIG
jgi:hypothetical protein